MAKKGRKEGRFVFLTKDNDVVFKKKSYLWIYIVVLFVVVVFVCLYLAYYFSVGSTNSGNTNSTSNQVVNGDLSTTTGKVSLDIEIDHKPKFWEWLKHLF